MAIYKSWPGAILPVISTLSPAFTEDEAIPAAKDPDAVKNSASAIIIKYINVFFI
jgi:hypothetical protein